MVFSNESLLSKKKKKNFSEELFFLSVPLDCSSLVWPHLLYATHFEYSNLNLIGVLGIFDMQVDLTEFQGHLNSETLTSLLFSLLALILIDNY